MIIVTLENDRNTLRTELPKPLDDLIDDIGSVGITIPLKDIKISKDSPYNIRLYSDSVLGQAVIERLNVDFIVVPRVSSQNVNMYLWDLSNQVLL